LEEALSGDDYLHDCWCYRQGTSVVTQSAVDCSAWLSDYLLTRTLVLISVFTIVLVNFVLKELIRVLGRYERHHTLSREQSSVTVKMFIGMFINTGLILLLVNANFQHLAGSETAFGLFFDGAYQDFVTEWFLSVGISLCLTIFINMFTPHLYPVLYIPLGWLRRQCCVQKNATQDELNKLFDGEKFDLAERYAAILNTIFVVLFYSSGMPIVLLMGALTFFFAFWFDKLSFLRLYKIPPRYDSSLAKLTIEICPIAVVLHLMLGMWFYTCPILTTDVYDANNTVKLVADSLQGYNVWGFGERLISGGSLPLLILAITMILIKFLLVFFGEVVLCGRCKFDCLERVQIKKNAVYMTYQQATQYVHMESYHVHNAPYYEAAFIKIPGRPHLTGEPTLSLLRHAQTETKKAATQAGVVIDMNAQHRYDRKQQHGNVVPPGAFATRSTGGPVTPRSPRSQTSWASPRTSPRVSPRASPRGSPKGGSRGSPSFSPKRPPLSPRQGRKPQQPRKTLSNTQPSSKITSISYGGTPPSHVKHIQSQPPKHPPVKTGPSRGSYKPGNVRPR
jgi:hypothetical protein